MCLHVLLESEVALNESTPIFRQAAVVWIDDATLSAVKNASPVYLHALACECNCTGNASALFYESQSSFFRHFNLQT